MKIVPRIGLLVSALLEDEWNKGGDNRPAALSSVSLITNRLSSLGTVIHHGLVESLADAEKARRAFIDEGVDTVLVMQLSFTQGITALRALREIHAPIIVWNTQFMDSIPPDADWRTLLVNSGVTGLTELTSALVRTGRKFSFVNGAFDSKEAWARVETLVNAAAQKRGLEGARIGMIGHPYQWMTDLMVDPLEVMERFGVILEYVEDGEIVEAIEGLRGSPEAAAYLAKIRKKARIAGMKDEALQRSVEYAIAVSNVVERRGFSALSFYEQGLLLNPAVGLTGALGMCELFSRGVPCASEADILTLVLMLIMKGISDDSTFLEHYGMDFKKNTLLMAHDSFGNWELADPGIGIQIEPTIFYHGKAGTGAAVRFSYCPGAVTLGSLTVAPPGIAERFRLIASDGESIPFQARPIPAPQMEFRPSGGDINGYYSSYCRLGGSHHMAGCYGSVGASLEAVASVFNLDFHVV